MKYFVCAENNAYNHWQLELLISSFQKLNLENDLYIALYKSTTVNTAVYYNRLIKHKNLFFFENEGNHEKNELLSLYSLKLTGKVVLIEPDFIIFNPVKPFTEDFIFQIDYSYTYESLSENVKNQQEKVVAKGAWLPIGATRGFEADLGLVEKALAWGNYLNDYRAGWVFGIFEGHLNFKDMSLEYTLLDTLGDMPFIHYQHGMPPSFHKKMFLCSQEAPLMLDSSPFKALTRETPSTASEYVAQLAQNYLDEFNIKY